MPATVIIRLRPSQLGRLLLATLHLAAGLAVLLARIGPPAQVLLLLAIAAGAAHALRPRPPPDLRLLPDGGLQIRAGADWETVTPLSGSIATPLLSIVRYRRDGSRRSGSALVLPDSADDDARRRLRVWLRWRADFDRLPPPA